MIRFFVEQVEGDRVRLDREDSHHLLRVLRARIGEPFAVLCGGMEYHCRLVGHHEGYAHGEVVGARPAAGEPAVHITLFQGLAKGDKLETVIQQGTQLGINEFVPVITSRSVVKLEPRKAAERVQRWRRIAREAAAQSRRAAVPHVQEVQHWHHAVIQSRHYDLALVPWEQGGESLRSVLAGAAAPRRIAIFIGPEGGLPPKRSLWPGSMAPGRLPWAPGSCGPNWPDWSRPR